MVPARAILLIPVLALAACRAAPAPSVRPATVEPTTVVDPPVSPEAAAPALPAPPAFEFALPSDWADRARPAFEELLAHELDGTRIARLEDSALETLRRALAAAGESAVRAALILARSRDPRAGEVLLAELEGRAPRAASEPVASVAAASFARWASARDASARLEALAVGKSPHALLDVRVECAAVALGLGRDAVIPFLLDVLREGTPSAASKPNWSRPDWTSGAFDAVQSCAARALSARARVPCTYRPEAAIAEREAEAARLARILLPLANAKE
jgi:hypothetical protein